MPNTAMAYFQFLLIFFSAFGDKNIDIVMTQEFIILWVAEV